MYAWFFGFQTAMVLEARVIARRAPVVRETPHILSDLSLSKTPGRRLSYFGYDFEVPWDDLDESKTKLYPTRVVLVFRSGKAMIFSTAPPRSPLSRTERKHEEKQRQARMVNRVAAHFAILNPSYGSTNT
jgi:hypothetical protein